MSFHTIGTTGWIPIQNPKYDITSNIQGQNTEQIKSAFIKCDINYSTELGIKILDISTRVETVSRKVLGFPPALGSQVTINGDHLNDSQANPEIIHHILDSQRKNSLQIKLKFTSDSIGPSISINT